MEVQEFFRKFEIVEVSGFEDCNPCDLTHSECAMFSGCPLKGSHFVFKIKESWKKQK